MTRRRDGQETKARILQTALEVFAELGYRDATIGEICRRARANVASVNYYFGGKQELYDEVWREAARVADELYPFDGGVPMESGSAVRLEAHIRSLLLRMTDSGRLGHLHRLMMKEQGNATGVIPRVFWETRRPFFERLSGVVAELLGKACSERDIDGCVRNILGMCRMARTDRELMSVGRPKPFTAAEIDGLADQIVTFSLSGIRGVRERAERDHVHKDREDHVKNA